MKEVSVSTTRDWILTCPVVCEPQLSIIGPKPLLGSSESRVGMIPQLDYSSLSWLHLLAARIVAGVNITSWSDERGLVKHFDLRGNFLMPAGLPQTSSFHLLSFEINYWVAVVFVIGLWAFEVAMVVSVCEKGWLLGFHWAIFECLPSCESWQHRSAHLPGSSGCIARVSGLLHLFGTHHVLREQLDCSKASSVVGVVFVGQKRTLDLVTFFAVQLLHRESVYHEQIWDWVL